MAGKKHIVTQSEWEAGMAEKIIEYIRSEIYLELPFFGIALGALIPQNKEGLLSFATDGKGIYFASEELIRLFKSNSKYLDRAYLHSVLHCIFSHLWIAGQRDRNIWGIACDIAVEYAIDTMDKDCTRRALTWVRQDTYRILKMELSGISAATIYNWLKSLDIDRLRILYREFYTDDHTLWPVEEDGQARSQNEARDNWNKIARQTSMEQKRNGKEQSEGQAVLAAQIKASRNQRSYRDFLKKFSVLREELHSDPDEFDLGFYTYGLRVYGNMPLVEPLESREIKKIQEFVIVLDTSYSTSGGLIKKFLKETFTILTESDSFFSKSHVRIIQCDDKVMMDEKVTKVSEIEALMNRFTVVGGGGTDFRPAFSYVNELIDAGELKNLSGLLYFTDGKGIYPKKRPAYKSAFIYLNDFEEELVPPWAIRYRLDEAVLEDNDEH